MQKVILPRPRDSLNRKFSKKNNSKYNLFKKNSNKRAHSKKFPNLTNQPNNLANLSQTNPNKKHYNPQKTFQNNSKNKTLQKEPSTETIVSALSEQSKTTSSSKEMKKSKTKPHNFRTYTIISNKSKIFTKIYKLKNVSIIIKNKVLLILKNK